MSKHICIFQAFEQVEIIKKSFDSMYLDSIDFFVIENKSENSGEIEEYFKDKKLKGYIQFDENIAFNAISIFMKDFLPLLKTYDYITFTDGDLYVYDIKDTFEELIKALEAPNTVISSSGQWQGNKHTNKEGDRFIGTHYYDDFMEKRSDIEHGYTFKHGAGHLLTIKKENLKYFLVPTFVDSKIAGVVYGDGKKWTRTSKNLLYHLTWDLYIDGNPYYEWKKSVYPQVWTEVKTSKYRKII